jgi:hypothetical protein
MDAPSHRIFRLATLLFATLLGLQSIWLLLTALSQPGIDRLPVNAQEAAIAASQRDDANRAAAIGAIRGDLWARSAFTYAGLLWAEPEPGGANALADARAELDKALRYAPHQSGAWLLLAGLESRVQPPSPNLTEALKMSYYTGPSERALTPLRVMVATRVEALADPDIQQFVRGDLRLLPDQQQKSVLVEAYTGASPTGKHFIEQALGDIDPASLGSLLPGARKP